LFFRFISFFSLSLLVNFHPILSCESRKNIFHQFCKTISHLVCMHAPNKSPSVSHHNLQDEYTEKVKKLQILSKKSYLSKNNDKIRYYTYRQTQRTRKTFFLFNSEHIHCALKKLENWKMMGKFRFC
jgi:hypothetical protein